MYESIIFVVIFFYLIRKNIALNFAKVGNSLKNNSQTMKCPKSF